MDIAEVLKWLLLAGIILLGFVALLLLGYPSRFTPGIADRSEAERAEMIEVDRRHHHLVNRGMAIVISAITGVLAVAMLADSKGDPISGLVMAAISVTSAVAFVLLIHRSRRRAGRINDSPDSRL
ncbi:hypothetical protein [Micromonospora sp. NBC_00617]|uniref:hypothetical protein n=1 Tax=Micromonospora sp. NBC_00617 TaxID=2903587 RepID=UPI0030E574B4